MNIKITIKDGQSSSTSFANPRDLSQVEHKKKTMLYAPPEKDRNNRQTAKIPPPNTLNTRDPPNPRKTNISTNPEAYRESEQQLLNQLKKNGQNKVTLDMVQSSNNILQRQGEILEQNQRVLHEQMKNKGKVAEEKELMQFRNKMEQKLTEISNQLLEIKKMKGDLIREKQQFDKAAVNSANNNKAHPQVPQNLLQMQSNFRNLVQISQNNLQGLQNMQAIKNLQNFNIQGYNQAINSLKKQITQYQKQCENIERELKIKAAKLQKLQVPPQFQQQLYKPYKQHLSNRVKGIDLHSIKDKVYQKLGVFDYGKFEYDVGLIMGEVQSELANFKIVCKEHRIVVPEIKLDQKQLKNMEIKIPSVLDEYKAARGIVFEDMAKQNKNVNTATTTKPKVSKTSEIQQRIRASAPINKPATLQKISTKPVDLAHEVRLTKPSDKKPSILQSQQLKQKQDFNKRLKQINKNKEQNQEFNKYLQNRAREQLQHIYKEQEERLAKMQGQLKKEAERASKIGEEEIRKKSEGKSPGNKLREQKKQEYEEEYQQYEQEEGKKKPEPRNEIIQQNKNKPTDPSKQIAAELLKQKLKNLLTKKQPQAPNPFPPAPRPAPEAPAQHQMQNMAQGFIAMINNTLATVNANLSRSIEKKLQSPSSGRPTSLQRPQTRQISIPKLQAFRPPPVFNMSTAPMLVPMSVPMQNQSFVPMQKQPEKKIVVEDYERYVIKADEGDNLRDYELSSDDDDI